MSKRDYSEDSEAKNPFDFLFDELSKLLAMVQNKQLISDDEAIPPDVEKRLEELRKKIDKFVKLSDDIVRLSGVSSEEIKMRISGVSEEVPPDGKRLIQRSKEVHHEAQKVSEKLEGELRYVPLNEKKISAAPEAPEKTREGKRRSKFKRFGSDKNWKPL